MSKIDENEGHGGSYVLDPKTNKRTLRERTAPPAGDTTPAEPAPTDTETEE